MARYADLDEVLKKITKVDSKYGFDSYETYHNLYNDLDCMETYMVRPNGEWLEHIWGDNRFLTCDQCGAYSAKDNTEFCPRCGADMRKSKVR